MRINPVKRKNKGFIFMFTIGGLSGVVLANASPFGDIAFHRRRHLLRSKSFSLRFEYGGAVFAMFSG